MVIFTSDQLLLTTPCTQWVCHWESTSRCNLRTVRLQEAISTCSHQRCAQNFRYTFTERKYMNYVAMVALFSLLLDEG